jgi:hypothetical protein
MPQFDIYSFFDQICLIILVFCLFYSLFLKYYLQEFSKLTKTRGKISKTSDDMLGVQITNLFF